MKLSDLKEKADKDKLMGQGKGVSKLIERYEKACEALTVISVLDYEWDFKQQRGLAAAGDIARNAIALYGPDKELG
jgi:hypothetical protein